MADQVPHAQTSHGAPDDDLAESMLQTRPTDSSSPAEMASRRFRYGHAPEHWMTAHHDGRTENVDERGLPIP